MATAGKISLTGWGELFSTYYPPTSLLDENKMIVAHGINVIAGMTGLGKTLYGSTVIVDMLNQGLKVLDLNCEDLPNESQERLANLLIGTKTTSQEYEATGEDFVSWDILRRRYAGQYGLHTGSLFLDSDKGATLFREICADFKPDFIRIGPLTRIMRGSDSNDDAVKAAIEVLLEQKQLRQPTILLDVHTLKSDPRVFRGSGEIMGCADNFLMLTKADKKGNEMWLASEKFRHGKSIQHKYKLTKQTTVTHFPEDPPDSQREGVRLVFEKHADVKNSAGDEMPNADNVVKAINELDGSWAKTTLKDKLHCNTDTLKEVIGWLCKSKLVTENNGRYITVKQ